MYVGTIPMTKEAFVLCGEVNYNGYGSSACRDRAQLDAILSSSHDIHTVTDLRSYDGQNVTQWIALPSPLLRTSEI
jgi:hypothetical protein